MSTQISSARLSSPPLQRICHDVVGRAVIPNDPTEQIEKTREIEEAVSILV